MKSKKLLALLLAFALTVSMIPINAFAAGSPTTNLINVDLTVSKSFGAVYDYYKANGTIDKDSETPVTTIEEYMYLFEDKGKYFPSTLTAEENLANINKAYSGSASVEVSKGDTLYVGVKLGTENLGGAYTSPNGDTGTDFKGISTANVFIKYNPSKLRPQGWGTTNNKTAFQNAIAVNLVGKSVLSSDPTNAYGGSFSIAASTNIVEGGGSDTGFSCMMIDYNIPSNFYLSEVNTWDFVIPMDVIAEDLGESDLTVCDTFYDKSSGDNLISAVALNDLPLTADNKTIDQVGFSQSIGNSDHIIRPEKVTAKVVNKTPDPVEPDPDIDPTNPDQVILTYNIVDKKNMPYVSNADVTAGNTDAKNGVNDYIIFPSSMQVVNGEGTGTTTSAVTGFKFGDTVAIFADEAGTKELGRTVLSPENAYNTTSKQWGVEGVTAATGAADEDSATDAAGYSFRLITGDNSTDSYGYLKGEDVVYISRVGAGENMGVSDAKIKVTVNAVEAPDADHDEDPLYYTGNVEAFETGLGSASNPVEVYLGETMTQVFKKLEDAGVTLPTTAKVPVESGATQQYVDVGLDWKQDWNTGSQPNMDAATGTFNKVTGTTAAEMKLPFGSTTVEGVNYGQPAAEYGKSTAPVYGSVMHVKVVPKPDDFFIVNDTAESGEQSLTILGGAYKTLKAGDTVKIYEGTAESNTLKETVTVADSTEPLKIKSLYTGLSNLTTAEDNDVYLDVTQSGVTSEKFAVTVSGKDNRLITSVDPLTGLGDNREVLMTTDSTMKQLFAELKPTFSVAGVADKIEVDAENLVEANFTIKSSTVTYPNVPGDSDWTEDIDFATFNGAKAQNKLYKVSYKLPNGTTTVNGEAINFINSVSSPKTLDFVAVAVNRIMVGNNDTTKPIDEGLSVAITQNDPNDAREEAIDTTEALNDTKNWDVFTISGDTYGSTDETNVESAVRVKDVVTVYDESNSVLTSGYIISKAQEGATWTYTAKVQQLGREPDPSKLKFSISRNGAVNLLASRMVPFVGATTVKEKYSFSKMKAYDPDLIKSAKTFDENATIADVYADTDSGLPKTADMEYGYKKYNASKGAYEIDETTVKTMSIDLDGSWTGGDNADTTLADTYFTGANTSTYSLTLPTNLTDADDGLAIVCPTDAQTLSVKFKLVGGKYTDTLGLNMLNSADTKVTNKPHPTNDELVIRGPAATVTEELTIKVYNDENKAKTGVNPILTVSVPTTAAVNTNLTPELGNDKLSAGSGALWFTVESAEYAPSTPVKKTYDVEPYIVWSTTISDTYKPVTLNLDTVNGWAAGDTRYNNMKAYFPTDMQLKVVHLETVNGVVQPIADDIQTATVTIGTNGYTSDGSTPLTNTYFDGTLSDGDTKSVTAVVSQDDLDSLKVKRMKEDNSGTEDVPLLLTTDEIEAANLRADGYDRDTFSFSYEAAEAAPFDLPAIVKEHPEYFIKGVTAGTPEVTDDQIVLNFKDSEDAGSDADQTATMVDPVYVTIEYTAPPKDGNTAQKATVSGTLDSNGKLTINTTDSTPKFEGFDISNTSMTLTFAESNAEGAKKAAPLTVNTEPISSESLVKEITNPMDLTIMGGTIQKAQNLMDIVSGVRSVKVTAKDNTVFNEVWLKGASADSSTQTTGVNAAWDLYYSDDGSTWTKSTDWPADLVYTAGRTFKLGVEVVEGEYTEGTLKYDTADSEKKLAEIPVAVYDNTKPDEYPVQLTTGNSDLYNSLWPENPDTVSQDDKAKATAELNKRNKGITDDAKKHTYKDYRSDLVLYYFIDSYEGFTEAEENKVKTVYSSPLLHVKDYLDAAGVKSVKVGTEVKEGGDLTTLLAAEGSSVTTLQMWGEDNILTGKANGDPITQVVDTAEGGTKTVDYIEPHHSDDKSKYFVRNASYTRLLERYVMRYVVTVNGKTIVADRSVKLTYRRGDTYFDNATTNLDVAPMRNRGTGAAYFLVYPEVVQPDAEGYEDYQKLFAKVDETNGEIGDWTNDGKSNSLDAAVAANVGTGAVPRPKMKW